MRIIRYFGAAFCFALAVSQLLPIYLIVAGLIQSQSEGSLAYFLGKLAGHILVSGILFYVAVRIFKKAQMKLIPIK